MREPFWFLDDGNFDTDIPYLAAPFYNIHHQESKASRGLDHWIARWRYGKEIDVNQAHLYMDPTMMFPWLTILTIMNIFFTLITLMLCFFYPDFLNLTVCALSFYFFYNENTEQKELRINVFLLIFGFVLDVIYLTCQMKFEWSHLSYDGDVERSVRHYSIVMMFISLIFRFFMIPVYWKVSVDFKRLFRERGD